MDKKKNALFKEIEKKAEKKTEDMLLCLLKKVRNTFDCNIWMESLADEHVLTEDARSGDSTAQFALSMYWLLKSADDYYPAAKLTLGLLYESLLKYRNTDMSAEGGYPKLCLDTATYLRERSFDSDVAEALEIEGSGMIGSGKERNMQLEENMICKSMAREYFEKGIAAEKRFDGLITEETFIHSEEGRMMLENFKIAMELGESKADEYIRKWEKYL